MQVAQTEQEGVGNNHDYIGDGGCMRCFNHALPIRLLYPLIRAVTETISGYLSLGIAIVISFAFRVRAGFTTT